MHMYMYMYMCVCVCVYVCMYVCVCMCIYIYIYIQHHSSNLQSETLRGEEHGLHLWADPEGRHIGR